MNNEIRLINAVSDLNRKVDQLQRTGTESAFFYGTDSIQADFIANTESAISFLEPIYNQGIICRINSGNTGTFTIMSSGLYLINLNIFASPGVADGQMRISVEPAGTLGFLQTQQVNLFGSSLRTAMTATTTQYLNEGDSLLITLIFPTNTSVTIRREGITAYKSPYLSLTQLTGGYNVTNSPNEWYGDESEDL
jgi:hypothetical protein